MHLSMGQRDLCDRITACSVEATTVTVGQGTLVAVRMRAHCAARRVLVGT